MTVNTLSVSEILQIYDYLVIDFADSGDPIEPVGVRDMNLLESAVSRQHVGTGGVMKYATPITNAASLGYGICNNHPFFNGNKRTALVSILAHLDRNKLSLWGVDQNALYEFMLAVAQHQVVEWVAESSGQDFEFRDGESDSDIEVRTMSEWLTSHANAVVRGEQRL